MDIKRSDILAISGSMNGLLELNLDPRVAFKVASNSILAGELADKIKKIYKPVAGFDEYNKERQRVLTDSGAVDRGDGTFSISAGSAERVNESLKLVEDEFSEVIEAQGIYDKKFNELLDRTEDVEFKEIHMDELDVKVEPSKLVPLIRTGILKDGDTS